MMITGAVRDLYQFRFFTAKRGVTEQVPASCKLGHKDSVPSGRLGRSLRDDSLLFEAAHTGKVCQSACGCRREAQP